MARVSLDRVLIVDTLHMGDAIEKAEVLRDPSHVRNYTEAEWRGFVEEAGLGMDDVRFWHTASTSAPGSSERVAPVTKPPASRRLFGDRVAGGRLTLDKIAIRAVKSH